MSPLDHIIRTEIAQTGPLSVLDYMTLCLSHPEHGYYRRQEAIGRAGDFITAPEISQIFGELIGLWAGTVATLLAEDLPIRLIEIGPGRGTLMSDALRALRVVPGLIDRLRVHLVEPSPALTAIQERTLAGAPGLPQWHPDLAGVPAGPSVVVANEVLDALPLRQLVARSGCWHERLVVLGRDGDLAFGISDVPSAAPPVADAPDDSILELRPGVDDLVAAIAARGRAYPCAALFVDYGHTATRRGDTLQAVRRHRTADPLRDAGDTDLSAQVDFEALARSAISHGLEADGPVPQAVFMGALGVVERAQRLMLSAPTRAADIEAGALRLIDPAGMGSRFKVLGLRSKGLGRLPGL
ncbi:MAG: SAM-dependent methyltransferase [Hyphomicrobiaceae bacterium]